MVGVRLWGACRGREDSQDTRWYLGHMRPTGFHNPLPHHFVHPSPIFPTWTTRKYQPARTPTLGRLLA